MMFAETKEPIVAEEQRLWPRRAVVLALNLASWLGLGVLMARIIGSAGWSWAGVTIMVLYLIALPWTLLAFWNAAIGFLIIRVHNSPSCYTNPALDATPADAEIISRTALCICIRHENVLGVLARIEAMRDDLDATSPNAPIEFHVLSDSTRPAVCAEEQAAFGHDPRLHYRRRSANIGYKAGNLHEFAMTHLGRIDFMIALDADSVMSAAAILRLVRVMQANPNLGILQTLVTGRPATSPFARIFQFGMRHGMRTHTTGIAWWQGPSGPYWGHNAIIRLRPFVAHCALPVLPEGLPLAGHILSHDQVEAALMRAAGLEVRVIADEFGSWEENPPRLPDFIRRDLRWCQGNLQYLRLLCRPGFRPMGRFQLCNAIAMYLGAPASILMLTVGVANGLTGVQGHVPRTLAFGLYFGMLILGFAPRLLGVVDILLRKKERKRWGGGMRILAGAVTDGLFSLMIGPVMMVAQSCFIFGLLFGYRIVWDAQQREDGIVPLREAVGGLWPQFLLGLAFGLAIWHVAPGALLWAIPTLAGSLLAIPFACVTANPLLGAWMRRVGLCAVPGE